MKAVAYLTEIGALRGRRLLVRSAAVTMLIWIPGVVISTGFELMFPDRPGGNSFATPWHALAGGVVLAPLMETMGMRAVFWVLRKITANFLLMNAASAVLWGALHFLSPGWGLHAVWPFFAMSVCYLSLERVSPLHALLVVSAIHAGANLLGYLFYLLMRSCGL